MSTVILAGFMDNSSARELIYLLEAAIVRRSNFASGGCGYPVTTLPYDSLTTTALRNHRGLSTLIVFGKKLISSSTRSSTIAWLATNGFDTTNVVEIVEDYTPRILIQNIEHFISRGLQSSEADIILREAADLYLARGAADIHLPAFEMPPYDEEEEYVETEEEE